MIIFYCFNKKKNELNLIFRNIHVSYIIIQYGTIYTLLNRNLVLKVILLKSEQLLTVGDFRILIIGVVMMQLRGT